MGKLSKWESRQETRLNGILTERIDSRRMVKKHMRNKSKRNKYQLMFPNENTAYEEPATVTFRKSTMREGMMWLTTATGVRHSITTIAAREYWNTCIANGWKIVEE